MTHTWDWLFVILPKDDKRKMEVLRNINEQICTKMKVGNFVLKFDFAKKYIYCDCVDEYEFKSKVVPGKISFEEVKDILYNTDNV